MVLASVAGENSPILCAHHLVGGRVGTGREGLCNQASQNLLQFSDCSQSPPATNKDEKKGAVSDPGPWKNSQVRAP